MSTSRLIHTTFMHRTCPGLRSTFLVALLASCSVNTRALAETAATFDEPETLPVTRAVMYASGVGYFEHRGEVHGNTTVRIMLQTDQINDMLKSMVVMDLDGGTVAGIHYAANDPLDRSLKSFGVDLSDNPTMPELLDQLRGAVIIAHVPDRIEGRILNIEKRTKKHNGVQQIEHIISLVTDRGMRSLPMSSVDSIELADQRLQAELNRALQMLIDSRDTEQQPVNVKLVGEGTRQVIIGYLIETPVWKTSYRLDLTDNEPYFQGWAIVENTTNNDWEGVRLSLVSGRPISFIQDLYTPLYAPRPEVKPQLFASLQPRLYDKGVETQAMRRAMQAAPPPAPPERDARRARGVGGGFGGGGLAADDMAESLRLRESGVASIADAGEVGEFFRFTIDHPVNMERRRSVMLPIINDNVSAERMSIYNKDVLEKHPLLGARLENTTDVPLTAGPITIYDDGEYGGDAQIGHLAPGDSRLLSYAIDLDLTVVESSRRSSTVTSATLVRGVLEINRVRRHITTYTINSAASRDRNLMIEHQRHHNRDLVDPESYEERTADLYRYLIDVKAGETVEFIVREDEPISQTVRVLDQPISQFESYVRTTAIPESIREALAKVIEQRQALAVLERKHENVIEEMREIVEDQERLRRNIETVGTDSSLGKRYVAQLSDDEDRLQELTEKRDHLKQQIATTREKLEEYLMDLRLVP